jgi:hypothetical protein
MAPSLSDDHTNAVINQLRVDRCDQGLHGEAGVYITRSEAPRAGPTQDRPDRTVATVTALLPRADQSCPIQCRRSHRRIDRRRGCDSQRGTAQQGVREPAGVGTHFPQDRG